MATLALAIVASSTEMACIGAILIFEGGAEVISGWSPRMGSEGDETSGV